MKRIEAIPVFSGTPDMASARALLGTEPAPALSISQALGQYWGLAADKCIGKSKDQLRRWRNPRIKAIKNLISVIGDKQLSDITREDLLRFRSWWLDKIARKHLTANSTNKDLTHAGQVLKRVNELKGLGLDLPISGLHLKEGRAKSYPAFSDNWIQRTLLAPHALDGLNVEARVIFLVLGPRLINTR